MNRFLHPWALIFIRFQASVRRPPPNCMSALTSSFLRACHYRHLIVARHNVPLASFKKLTERKLKSESKGNEVPFERREVSWRCGGRMVRDESPLVATFSLSSVRWVFSHLHSRPRLRWAHRKHACLRRLCQLAWGSRHAAKTEHDTHQHHYLLNIAPLKKFAINGNWMLIFHCLLPLVEEHLSNGTSKLTWQRHQTTAATHLNGHLNGTKGEHHQPFAKSISLQIAFDPQKRTTRAVFVTLQMQVEINWKTKKKEIVECL